MTLTAGSRGISLMQRVNSPTVQPEKPPGKGTGWALGSTNPGSTVASMNSTMGMGTGHHSSPFRSTIARGMVTGVGFLGK